jgi:DNA (cytosine-5)-methyltransferase 1
MERMPMTFGSLFAGIGGFDLGLERAGMTCKWQVERDAYAASVLAKHWPDVTRWSEVETFPPDEGDDWKVDLICAGVPCQPVSVAGKQKGKSDERWMWGECLRVVATFCPRFFVAENPAALLSDDGGRTFAGIVAALQEAGYDAQWQTIAAGDLGAPHRRSRVFLVAWKRASVGEMPVLPGLPMHDSPDPRSGLQLPAQGRMGERPVQDSHALADANGEGLQGAVLEHPSEGLPRPRCRAGRDEEQDLPEAAAGWWQVEPDVGRVAHGVSCRVDRLRCLGNAVVPQVVEIIGRAILEAEAEVAECR